ncbi:hypothetical protein ACSTIX_24280, partial [Vibrio parahaemolyticus]
MNPMHVFRPFAVAAPLAGLALTLGVVGLTGCVVENNPSGTQRGNTVAPAPTATAGGSTGTGGTGSTGS